MTSILYSHPDWTIAIVLICIFSIWPRLANSWIKNLDTVLARLTSHRFLTLAAVFALPILIRLSLVHWFPVPTPHVHDEFSYLLAADTFAHGRVANAAHPMWIFFDTFHELQQPTYASMYPPAQGMILAVGQLLGHPWIGVLLSVAAMCAAFQWMLEGWMPRRWALVGSAIVIARFSIFSYWMNSYWGGAVAAFAGALVTGALPRLMRRKRVRDAVILAVGIAILANSRPFEGLVLCLPVAIVLLRWIFVQKGPERSGAFFRLVFPVSTILCLVGAFMLYYNWRVTKDPLVFPHTLNVATYHSVPMFVWGKLQPPKQYANPQFEKFFNQDERNSVPRDRTRIIIYSYYRFIDLCTFFLGPALLLPFLAIWPLCCNLRTRFLLLQLSISVLATLTVVWFQPHYLAPALGILFVILIQALRHMRTWRFGSWSIGLGLTKAIVLSALLIAPVVAYVGTDSYFSPFYSWPADPTRQDVLNKLQEMPGKHLVIVRYSEDHDANDEWVYNGASIDNSRIVWAREIPGRNISPLIEYFHDRSVWLVEPDVGAELITHYTALPSPN